jgi:hypothetical protein
MGVPFGAGTGRYFDRIGLPLPVGFSVTQIGLPADVALPAGMTTAITAWSGITTSLRDPGLWLVWWKARLVIDNAGAFPLTVTAPGFARIYDAPGTPSDSGGTRMLIGDEFFTAQAGSEIVNTQRAPLVFGAGPGLGSWSITNGGAGASLLHATSGAGVRPGSWVELYIARALD